MSYYNYLGIFGRQMLLVYQLKDSKFKEALKFACGLNFVSVLFEWILWENKLWKKLAVTCGSIGSILFGRRKL